MKISRRQFLEATAALAATSAFAACGAASSTTTDTATDASTSTDASTATDASAEIPTELNFYIYYVDASVPVIDETLVAMKELYPDLTINIEHRTDASGDVLKTKAAVGELPDMIEMQPSFTQDFIDAGYLLPLNDAIEAAGLFDKYVETFYKCQQSPDGTYYVFRPKGSEPYTIFYNKTVFDDCALEEPKNYEEFKTVITTLKDNGYMPLSLFGEQRWPGLQLFDVAVIANGNIDGIGALEDGASITDDCYVAAAKQMEEIIGLGLIGSGAFSTNASQAFEYFGMDQAGMMVNGAWFFTDAIANGYADRTYYFHYNPFAAVGDEEKYRYAFSGGGGEFTGFGASATTKNPEFTKKVLADFIYLFNMEEAKSGKITALVETVETYEPLAEGYTDFMQNMQNVESNSDFGWSMANPELLETLKVQNELLMTGTYSADNFIADLDEMIADVLG